MSQDRERRRRMLEKFKGKPEPYWRKFWNIMGYIGAIVVAFALWLIGNSGKKREGRSPDESDDGDDNFRDGGDITPRNH